jgi:hypothetical protein
MRPRERPPLSGEQAINGIVKILDRLEAYGHSRVFEDWISIMLCSLNSPPREAEYLNLIRPYGKPREEGRDIDRLAQAFGLAQIAMAQTHQDVLGTVYERFTEGSKSRRLALGQFFTPIPVCDLVVEVMGGDDSQPQSVLDPGSGSGRLLISAAKRLHPDSLFTAIDKDRICADMSALNLLFFNLNGMAMWGDALSSEFWGGYQTQRTVLGGMLSKMTEEEVKRTTDWLAPRIQTTQVATTPPTLVQMSLFD